MGFGGGGSGALPAHQHSNVPLSGGPLDMANVTIGSLNQGSVVYSDGAALQELVMPGVPAGELLTFAAAATAPSWASGAAGGSLTLIDNTVLGADDTEIDTTFAAVEQGTEMSGIMAVLNASRDTTNGFYIQVNGITTGTYHYAGQKIDAGVSTLNNSPANSIWQPYASGGLTAQDHLYFRMFFTAGDPTLAAAADKTLRFSSIGVLDGAIGVNFWGTNSTTNQTSLDEIKIQAPTGNILEGSSLSIYKIGV